MPAGHIYTKPKTNMTGGICSNCGTYKKAECKTTCAHPVRLERKAFVAIRMAAEGGALTPRGGRAFPPGRRRH